MTDLSQTIDLSTQYLGLKLKNPIVASSSPLCEDLGNIKRMEDEGVAAVVLHSLFEEQIEHEMEGLHETLMEQADHYSEATSYFPDLGDYKLGPDKYLEHISRCKGAVKIPVIASLNGNTTGGWTSYAKLMEQAGADALELNVYHIPTDLNESGEAVEQRYIDLVKAVKASVTIPVAVKLGPAFSAMGNMGKKLDAAGADALVLFNRFYQPDFDLEALEVVPNLILSNAHELLLRLHWVAVLYGNVRADLAITGGVHQAADIVKSMMAGARVAMMTSAILKYGIHHVDKVLDELLIWLGDHEYDSIRQMQGSMSRRSVAKPSHFERANYMKVLNSYAFRATAR